MADDDAELAEFREWKKQREEKKRKGAKVRVWEVPLEYARDLLGRDEGDDDGDDGDEGGKGGGFFGDRT